MTEQGGDATTWRELTSHRPVAVVMEIDDPEPCSIEPWLPGMCEALRGVLVQVVLVSEARRSRVDGIRGLVPAAWWYVEYGAWRYATSTWVGQRTRRELDDLASTLVSALNTDVQLARTAVSLALRWPQGVDGEIAARAADLFARWALQHTAYQLTVGPAQVDVRLRSATKKAALTWVRQRLPEVRCVIVGLDETTCTAADIAVPRARAHGVLSSLVELRATTFAPDARRLAPTSS